MSSGVATLLWSPTEIVYTDGKGSFHSAPTFAAVAGSGIRSAIVLIAHRNSLVRTTKVPNLKRAQLEPLVRAKTNSLVPGGANNFSFGFRVGNDPAGGGKLAILGGTKTETLRRINSEAQAAGIKLLAVLPSSFAAWNAANEHHLKNGIVVSQEGSDLCLDVISEGELVYSRFSQARTPAETIEEIQATFQTAGVVAGSVLTLGQLDVPRSDTDPRSLLSFASDPGQINRSLFTLELPEAAAKREKRKVNSSAQRGVVCLVAAVAAWAIVLVKHQQDVVAADKAAKLERAMDVGEQKKLSGITKETTEYRQKAFLLNVAFDPAQTFGDMVAVLGHDSGKAWLTGLSIERGGMISIRGGAQDQKTISEYAAKLRKEPRFRDVQIRFTTKGQLNNVPIFQFAISAWAVGNLPFDQYVEAVSK